MNYPDDSAIHVGDLVFWNERRSVGHIANIVESADELEHWNLDEPGVLVSGFLPRERQGNHYFIDVSHHEQEGLAKLTRHQEFQFEHAFARAKFQAGLQYSNDVDWAVDVTWDENPEAPASWSFHSFKPPLPDDSSEQSQVTTIHRRDLIWMRFPDGSEPSPRGPIWWANRTRIGYVCRVFEEPSDIEAEGLDEGGISIGYIFPIDLSFDQIFRTAQDLETEEMRALYPREESEIDRARLLAVARSNHGFKEDHPHWIEPLWGESANCGWAFHWIERSADSVELKEIECIVIPPAEVSPLPLNYPDGTAVRDGDLVWWNGGSRLGYVRIVSPAEEDFCGRGIFIIPGYPFTGETGGINYPIESFEEDGIGLFSPEEQAGFDHALEVAAADPSLDPKAALLHVSPRIDNDETWAWLAGWEVTYSQPDGSKREIFVPVPSAS